MDEVLLHRAEADADRIAFAHREERVSFGQLADRADQRARALASDGVGRGDRVAIVLPTGIALVETFWACQLLGAAPCVINPALTADVLSRRVRLIRPRIQVTEGRLPQLAPSGSRAAAGMMSGEEIAFLQLTSGTSGEPRASMIRQRNVMAYLRTCRTNALLGSEDVLVGWVPPWHDLGLIRFVIGPVFLGARCHLVDAAVSTIPEWLETISRERGTYSAAPDFATRLAVRMVKPEDVDLSCLRFLKLGAEPIRATTIDRFERAFGTPGVALPGYGLGEATLAVSEHLPGDGIAVDEHGNVSCGLVNPGLEVQAGRQGAPNEIRVRGATVFAGYLDAPEETEWRLRDGWLHTGDLGYLDDHGRLFVLGRREGMIKRAGAVVAPLELEQAAERVAGVRIAMATAVTDASGEEIVAVAVETDDRLAEAEVSRAVSREIQGSVGFAPERVAVLPRRTMPRTENGKLRHGQLREMLEADPQRRPIASE